MGQGGASTFEFADGGAHMSPEELLQLKRDRLAMGLEPQGGSAQELVSDGVAALHGPIAAPAEVCLAQPVSLLQAQGVGVRSLPESERAVVDGMPVSELVVQRRVEAEHDDAQALDKGAQIASTQAQLAALNTPESLPLEVVQSA